MMRSYGGKPKAQQRQQPKQHQKRHQLLVPSPLERGKGLGEGQTRGVRTRPLDSPTLNKNPESHRRSPHACQYKTMARMAHMEQGACLAVISAMPWAQMRPRSTHMAKDLPQPVTIPHLKPHRA